LLHYISNAKADIVCLQEVKTECPLNTPGYLQYWFPAKESGYSGTLVLSRREPLSVKNGMGIQKFDREGRIITLEYEDFYLLNIYVPSIHTYSDFDRVGYRLEWDKTLKAYISKLRKPLIMCGDFNVAREYIDVYPENQKNTPTEDIFRSDIREGFEQLLSIGLADAFRYLYPNRERAYTWWGPKNNNRALNRGSRLDYFLVSAELLSFIREVSLRPEIHGSDHCPIELEMSVPRIQEKLAKEDYAVLWRTTDWTAAQAELLEMQRELAQAVFDRRMSSAKNLREKIERSWAARALAVKVVTEKNTAAGVDGLRRLTHAQMGEMALTLTPFYYNPLPYRRIEIEEKGRVRPINIPAIRDRAMQTLEKFVLEPIVSSTVDAKVCAGVKGRSLYDANSYLIQNMSGRGAPDYVVLVDVTKCYESTSHDWLLNHIPLNRDVLKKILTAGVLVDEKILPSEGMSLAGPLSPLMLNIMLSGLRTYIFDRLYPNGNTDFMDGNVIRAADDMAITTRSRQRGELIVQLVQTFLSERGLQINRRKTKIADARRGFDFLGRHYQKWGDQLIATPSKDALEEKKRELSKLITSFNGSLRDLIMKINSQLRGFGNYHKCEDAYKANKELDTAVELLLLDKMCLKYPRWHREAVKRRFWLKEGGSYVFALPQDHSIRVIQLAQQPIVWHEPCKPTFNWFLDIDYHNWLDERRRIQKICSDYRPVWNRQSGKCAYCSQPLLPDQEWDVIENHVGEGRNVRNLLYVHSRCAAQSNPCYDSSTGEYLNLVEIGEMLLETAPLSESPYWELTEFFRLCDYSPVRLTFQEIERIIGDHLSVESRFYEAFWYDDQPGQTDPMWDEEEYPFQKCLPANPDYAIAQSWVSQGYKIKYLHLAREYVVFQRTTKRQSGLVMPEALLKSKLPESFVQEYNAVCKHLMKKYGL